MVAADGYEGGVRANGERTLALMLALVALAFPASAAAQVNSASLWRRTAFASRRGPRRSC